VQSRDSASVEAVCKAALIGTGTAGVQIQFPEQNPIPVNSKLLVFNGGEAGGTITARGSALLRRDQGESGSGPYLHAEGLEHRRG
jgi:hypothetical protein